MLRSTLLYIAVIASLVGLGASAGSAAGKGAPYSACNQGRSWLGNAPGAVGFSVRCHGLARRPLVMFRIARPGIRSVSAKPSARRADGEPVTARCKLVDEVPECSASSRGTVVIRGRLTVRPRSRCSKSILIETRLLRVCGDICLLPADWRTISDRKPKGCGG